MTTLREAVQQALEALENLSNCYAGVHDSSGECASCHERSYMPHAPDCKKQNAIIALRAALAQQEQEPVAPYAWMAVGGTIWRRKTSEDDVPLYTHPPRREWRSLSEGEVHDCFQQRHKDKATERRMIALAVEQALRSKNQ
jgi:hypothetical protein